jgi:hypothetical protein
MAKAGYAYQAKRTKTFRGGLRELATNIDQFERHEVLFDHHAYDAHHPA